MQGLRKIRETGQSIGVPIRVYGPETHITAVVPMALGLMDGATVPEFDEVSEGVRKLSRKISANSALLGSWHCYSGAL